jgi:hypothetical protein
MPSSEGHSQVLLDVTVQVQRERVNLRLLNHDGVLVVERKLIQPDGVSVTLAVPFRNEADLYDFATADPYYDYLKSRYDVLRERYTAAALPM